MAVYEAEERETVLLFDGIKKVWTIQTNVLSHMNGFKDKIKPETLKQEIDEALNIIKHQNFRLSK